MTSLIQLLLAVVVGALIVFYSIPVVVKISKQKKLFDVPDDRKVNKTVVPNLGGASLFIAITITTLLALYKIPFPELRFILASMIILLFIGIKDDIMILSARKKFIAQILSAAILIFVGDIRFTNLHGIFGFFEINYSASAIISLIAYVGIINAYNLIDGIDGLATMLSMLAAATFGTLFIIKGDMAYAILAFATIGSLASFFFYNVFGKKNKIFMGDTGSLLLGLLIAIFVIHYNQLTLNGPLEEQLLAPVLSMAVVSIPLFDMVRVFGLRIMKGKSPFFPDMNHIHHKLLKLKMSHLRSTLTLVIINLFFIGLAYLIAPIDNTLQLVIMFTVAILLSLVPGEIFRLRKAAEIEEIIEKENIIPENTKAIFFNISKQKSATTDIKAGISSEKKETAKAEKLELEHFNV